MGGEVRVNASIDTYIEKNRGRYEDELKEFLRIPSVSAAKAHVPDVKKAAAFVADQIKKAGLDVETIETSGHPLVVGEWLGAPGAPTILVYGHYDVQPPDPLDLWITPPFEPTVRNGNIVARGATDDKGQMFTHVKALEAWLATEGNLPVNVKVIIEGEEEVGSAAIGEYLPKNAKRLACDYIVISDTSQFAPEVPAVTYGLKGIAYFEVLLQGPNRDLHSGTFGGSVQNPCNAIGALIASLKDADGRIQLPGFYDDVVELSPLEREQMKKLPFSDAAYASELGVKELFGEKGYSTLERKWARPTCDVNGLWGGYQGEGSKTVLPAKAGVKVSFRLVPNQDPDKVAKAFEKHVRERLPVGVTAEVIVHHGAEPIVVPLDSPGVRAAARAIEAGFGKPPVYIREGGSIPIVSAFKKSLGADSLLLGFGLPDDNTHSPNEKFCLKDFHRGIKTSAHLLAELAKETI